MKKKEALEKYNVSTHTMFVENKQAGYGYLKINGNWKRITKSELDAIKCEEDEA